MAHYFDQIFNSRIAIFGIEPPPFGGVSVHISRVMDQLCLQDNALFLWDTEQKTRRFFPWYLFKMLYWLITKRVKVLFYHSTYLSSAPYELYFLLFVRWFLRYKIVIVDHDCRHLSTSSATRLKIFQKVAKKVDSIVCIGKSTFESYTAHKIEGKCTAEDGFIPPVIRNGHLISQTYPSSLQIFMKERTPLLLLSAAHLMRINGQDMYGIDFALELIAAIQKDFPDAGLIIGLARISDMPYFQMLQLQMKKLTIAEQVYILHNNKELWPLFEKVDLFLRPTRTDGDSISVREALYFKVPVIASDVVERPKSVHIYQKENVNNCASLTEKVLREYVYGSQRNRDFMHP